MNTSSDDEIARDSGNTANKIPGAVGERLTEIQEKGMSERRVKVFESELKGTYNHKISQICYFILKILVGIKHLYTMALYLLVVYLGICFILRIKCSTL